MGFNIEINNILCKFCLNENQKELRINAFKIKDQDLIQVKCDMVKLIHRSSGNNNSDRTLDIYKPPTWDVNLIDLKYLCNCQKKQGVRSCLANNHLCNCKLKGLNKLPCLASTHHCSCNKKKKGTISNCLGVQHDCCCNANSNQKCLSVTHNCLCQFLDDLSKCLSTRHACRCLWLKKTKRSHNDCRSSEHVCCCQFIDDDLSKCLSTRHTCRCLWLIKSKFDHNDCRSSDHDCLCSYLVDTSQCKTSSSHTCICELPDRKCQAIKLDHQCICLKFCSKKCQAIIDHRCVCVLASEHCQRHDVNIVVMKANKDCAICMDPTEPSDDFSFLPCAHYFHQVCISEWFLENNSCPLCRVEIYPHEEEYDDDFDFEDEEYDHVYENENENESESEGSTSTWMTVD